MSSYLSFRKNGVELCSFSRSTKIYQAFPRAPYSEWKEVDGDTLRFGIDSLKEDHESVSRELQIYNRMISNNHLGFDELYELSSSIQGYQDELDEIDRAIHYIDLLILISDEYACDENKARLEWCVD